MQALRGWAGKRSVQLGVGAALLVLILALGWWQFGRHVPAEPVKGAEVLTTATSSDSGSKAKDFTNPTIPVNGEAVTVDDQPASTSVRVASVTLDERGWVAVRDAKGWILGAGLFPAGTEKDVEVPLMRATTAGERYQVLLYIDNGNKQFDLHDDILVTNADGSVAGTMFSAQ